MRDFLLELPSLSSEMRVEDAAEFLGRGHYEFAVVERAGEALGVCSRTALADLLGSRFGFALHGRAAVAGHIDRDLMEVRIDQPLVEILNRVFSRDERTYWRDVILLDSEGKFLGVVKAHRLASLQSALVAEKIAHLEERQAQLEEANALLSDLTDRLQASNRALAIARDEGLSAARAKSEFLAVMSHEIRTPLNGILGMISLLKDSPLNDEQMENLDVAHVSAEGLLLILNDILDFSRLEESRIELDLHEFSIRELAESCIGLVADKAGESDLEIVSRIDTDLPDWVVGDSGRIRQVLGNLIGNAAKFTKAGEIQLSLQPAGGPSDGRASVLFEVADSGIGISEAALSRLFKPFSQADSSTTRKFGGTGLGLAICKKLVEAMEGEIGARSVEGKGSTFWFRIPLSPARDRSPGYRVTRASEPKVALVLLSSERLIAALEPELAVRNITPLFAAGADQCDAVLRDDPSRVDLVIAESSLIGPDLEGVLGNVPIIRIQPPKGASSDHDDAGGIHLRKPIRWGRFDRAISAALGLGAEPRPRRVSAASSNALGADPSKFRRVLLVEDQPINRQLATRILKRLRFECVQAENGVEALKVCERERFPVILLDCRMPVMDGYEFARRLRQIESERSVSTPTHLIALTANAMQGDRELCYAVGMNDYLTKPFKQEDLRRALEKGFALAGDPETVALIESSPRE